MTRVVIHADDVGFCHAANRAFVELSAHGTVTAGSVMVPCPAFEEMAEVAAADPSLDVGVHLTLTAEHATHRWGPVADHPASAGLVDTEGMLWRDVASVRRHADPEAVETEWRAQIDRALAGGIRVTHLDAHMGCALAPEWCDRYITVGADYGVPVLIPATISAYGPNKHLAGVAEEQFAGFVAEARAAGMPVFDQVLETDFRRPLGAAPDYESLLSGASGDLVYCAFHPAVAGSELTGIDPDRAHVRSDEYELFVTDGWKRWLGTQSFAVAGMAEL